VSTQNSLIFPEIFESIRAAVPQGSNFYLVGGAVRDALLGKEAHDLDFSSPSDPTPIAKEIANGFKGAFFSLDDERSTVRVLYTPPLGERYSIDFTRFRGEDLEADLRGRDFTINAIAIDTREPQILLDPLGGYADLRAGLLRGCAPTSFSDDPLRILRGIRLAASLDFHILPETRQAMLGASPGLERVSAERKRDELFRILDGPRPAQAIQALDWLEALPYLLPELNYLKGVTQSPPHTLDVWHHTLTVLGFLHDLLAAIAGVPDSSGQKNPWILQSVEKLEKYRQELVAHFAERLNPNRSLAGVLALATLYHDIAKPATREEDANGRIQNLGHEKLGAEAAAMRAQALQLSNIECERLRKIVRHHMHVHSLIQTGSIPTRRAAHRFFRNTGDAGIDIIILTLADVLGTYGATLTWPVWNAYLETGLELMKMWWEEPRELILPKGILNGHDLQKDLKMAPGPWMSLLLDALREAEAVGTIHNREEALEFSRRWLKSNPVREP